MPLVPRLSLFQKLAVVMAVSFLPALSRGDSGPSWAELRAKAQIEKQRMLDDLSSRQIIGVEVLLAGSSLAAPESLLGHTSIRFLDSNDNAQDDITIGYAAEIDEEVLDRQKALSGGYAMGLEVKNFGDYLLGHLGTMQRTVRRYVVQSTPQQLQSLRAILLRHSSQSPGPYRIQDENCVGRLMKTFAEAGYPIHSEIFIPLKVGYLLMTSGVSSTPPIDMVNAAPVIQKFRPYIQRNKSGELMWVSQLQKSNPLEFMTWFLLDAAYIRHQQAFGASLLNKPPVDLLAIPFDQVVGLARIPVEFYQAGNSLEWKDRAEFTANKPAYCMELGRAYWRSTHPITEEMRLGFLETYRAKCL